MMKAVLALCLLLLTAAPAMPAPARPAAAAASVEASLERRDEIREAVRESLRTSIRVYVPAMIALAALAGSARFFGRRWLRDGSDRGASLLTLLSVAAGAQLAGGLAGEASPVLPIGAVVLTLVAVQALALARREREAEALRLRAEGLQQALEAARRPGREAILAVRVRNGRRLVQLCDIDAIRAADDYCELVLIRGDRLLHSATLEALARELPASFRRIHRSVIVNLERIELLRRRPSGGYEILTKTGEVLPVGRAYLAAARAAVEVG